MHRNKRIKAGRPSKEKQQEGAKITKSSDDENEYIADDSDCEKLFSLIARQSSYKNITKTGPAKGKRTDDNQITEAADKVKETLKELNMEDIQFFFLSTKKRVFQFENEKLMDKTDYKLIPSGDFPHFIIPLINKLNIVCKELDDQFINILTLILKLYEVRQEMNEEQMISSIVNHIRLYENRDQFQYILNWEKLKNITKETRMNRAFEDLDEKRTEILKKSSEKVKRKHLDFIDGQYKEIEEERDQEPLEYLISKLIAIFKQIIKDNE